MPAPGALAFDVYGTLVDPIRIATGLERHAPVDEAARIAAAWRRRQLEFSFRLTAMERYEDFEWVTARALDRALAEAGRDLDASARESLLAQYGDLDTFPDTRRGLERRRAGGHTMVVFSNGSPRMLDAILDSSGLRGFFDECVSVDEVRAFKPSPRTYRHVAARLGRPIEQIRLVSSNPFDVIGAEAAGMQAVCGSTARAVCSMRWATRRRSWCRP